MQISDAVKRIQGYLNNSLNLPFFVSVEDGNDYVDLCEKFSGLHIVKVSDYCEEDSQPDYDKLFDTLKHTISPTLLLGMGEAVQFAGDRLPIQSIKSSTFRCKIIIPCRGIGALLDEFCANETRFAKQRFCSVDGTYNCSVIGVSTSFKYEGALRGYKSLLQTLESGIYKEKLYVQTDLPIKTTYRIDSAYSAIKENSLSVFTVPHSVLSDKEWQEYLSDRNLEGYPLQHWRTYLSYLLNPPTNTYLRAVTTHSADYSEYQYNLLNYILDVPYQSKTFAQLYRLRKELFKGYGTDKISAYIAQSQQKGSDRVYYLTDNTPEERYEIIMAISESQSVPENIDMIYPDLANYLYDYVFPDSLPKELTGYFTEYKLQKLFNKINPDFLSKVDALSKDGKRIFNYLRAKNSIIEKHDDSQTKLVWVDALGVEYLGFIQKIAKELDLSLTIQIGRAVLPTLTVFNSDFYRSWNGKKAPKIDKLDNIKHEGISYRDLGSKDAPVYLSDELAIIRGVLEKIKGMLLQDDKAILLASDHGASRLVILHDHKNQWTMKDIGKHGGRCCPLSDIDTKPDYASEETTENGDKFWVLANYDRFQGGRESGVELHGGATLEEVVVPIIKVELADSANRPKIICETPETQFTDTQDPVIIIFCPTPVNHLQIKIESKLYRAEKQEDNRYKIVLKNCEKRQRTVLAECLDGDDLLTSFEVQINRKNKGMKEDKFADEFFKW